MASRALGRPAIAAEPFDNRITLYSPPRPPPHQTHAPLQTQNQNRKSLAKARELFIGRPLSECGPVNRRSRFWHFQYRFPWGVITSVEPPLWLSPRVFSREILRKICVFCKCLGGWCCDSRIKYSWWIHLEIYSHLCGNYLLKSECNLEEVFAVAKDLRTIIQWLE